MNTRRSILMILILVGCVSMLACATVRKDRKIEFVYLALGASDATGVGAIPLTEGYVFLIKRELEKRVPGSPWSISEFQELASISSKSRSASRPKSTPRLIS